MSQTTLPKSWELYIKAVPLFSGLLIFLGVLKQMALYGEFHIPITDFLHGSEILTSFLDELLLLVLVLGIFIASSVLRYFATIQAYYSEEDKKAQDKIFMGSLITSMVLGLIALIPGTAEFPNGATREPLARGICWVLMFLTTPHLILAILLNRWDEGRIRKVSKVLWFFSTFIVLIGGAMAIGLYEAKLIRHGEANLGNSFTYEGKIIVSDSSNYIVGKTRDYLFFYHEEEDMTDVIPVKKIDQLKYRQFPLE